MYQIGLKYSINIKFICLFLHSGAQLRHIYRNIYIYIYIFYPLKLNFGFVASYKSFIYLFFSFMLHNFVIFSFFPLKKLGWELHTMIEDYKASRMVSCLSPISYAIFIT